MILVSHLLDFLEVIAPNHFAYEWDKIGLQIGSLRKRVDKVVVSLDPSQEAIDYTLDQKADALICHHPLIWDPLTSIHTHSGLGEKIGLLLRNDLAFLAAHTNWDAATGGINDTLAEKLALQSITHFGKGSKQQWLGTYLTIPKTHVDLALDALDKINVGIIENYRRCAFFFEGEGTFESGLGATPYLGKANERKTVQETSIFIVFPKNRLDDVERILNDIHPYETPFLNFISLEGNYSQPLGRIGELSQAFSFKEFIHHVEVMLGTKCLSWGDPCKEIIRVAVLGGAAGSEWKSAQEAGADIFITGEVKQSDVLMACESKMSIIQAGHFATENPGCVKLAQLFQANFSQIEVVYFEPQAGQMGRPL